MNYPNLIVAMMVLVNFIAKPLAIADDLSAKSAKAKDTNSQTDTSPTITLQEITVVGSKENTRNLPGSGAYLGIRDIRTHSYSDINRILRKVPGVYLREEDGYGLFPNISLRGVDPGRSGKVTMMEDGILTAPAPYSAPSAYYSPTTGRMNGIEVLKGSSQIKYGPHTTGGVINYLSTPIPTTRQFYIKNLVGTDNEIHSHSHYGDTIETSSGKFGVLVENFYREVDGFKEIDSQDDIQTTDHTGFRVQDAMMKVSYEPNTSIQQRVELKVGYMDRNANETYLGLTDEDFDLDPFRRYSASRFDNIKTNHLRSYLRYSVAPSLNFNISVTGYYNDFHRNWFKLRGGGDDLLDPETLAIWKGEAAGTLKYRNNNRDYFLGGVQSNVNFKTETGGIDHVFDFGVRYHLDEVRRFQSNVNFEQDANGNIVGRVNEGPGSGGNRLQETAALAVFLQDQVDLGSLKLTPGLRFEHTDYSFTDFDTEGQPDKVTGQGESSVDILAPGIGINYDATNEVSAFASGHRGFSVPGPRANAKSKLVEETSTGLEAGFRYNNIGLRAEVIGFYTDFNDLLVADNIGGGGVEGKTENAGDIISLGVEAAVTYDPGFAHSLGFSVPSHVSFTYTNATLDGNANSLDPESIFAGGQDGNRVPYIPEVQFNVGTGVEFAKWGVFLNGTFVDETFTSASESTTPVAPDGTPNANYGITDSYLVLDLSGKYNINEGLSAVLNIYNLTDQKYVVSRHPIGPRPGKPMSATFGIETRF